MSGFDNDALINLLIIFLPMTSRVLDDFIDDCFLSGDDICKFEIYRSRKYENRVNPIASQLIDSKKNSDLNKDYSKYWFSIYTYLVSYFQLSQ